MVSVTLPVTLAYPGKTCHASLETASDKENPQYITDAIRMIE